MVSVFDGEELVSGGEEERYLFLAERNWSGGMGGEMVSCSDGNWSREGRRVGEEGTWGVMGEVCGGVSGYAHGNLWVYFTRVLCLCNMPSERALCDEMGCEDGVSLEYRCIARATLVMRGLQASEPRPCP